MNEEAIIAIFVVTYNQEKTIERTLKSVIEQKISYKYKIKILDDCSTDSTRAICEKYRDMYPDIIELIVENKNTRCGNTKQELCKIKSKYWTLLEGDDYWCDDTKIQRALDFLEKHEEYTGYATDYLLKKPNGEEISGARLSGINLNTINNAIKLETGLYVHTSARVLRNIIDWRPLINHKCFGDALQMIVYLDKGPWYFENKITSIYDQSSNSGLWSKLSEREQIYRNEIFCWEMNKLFNYKYDAIFSMVVHKALLTRLKRKFGLKFGWFLYMAYRFFVYKNIIKDYVEKNSEQSR